MNASFDHATTPINQALSGNEKVGFLRDMMRIRRFEQASLKQYQAGKMGGCGEPSAFRVLGCGRR